jgi:GNAT superfamily N-acetyltransferase
MAPPTIERMGPADWERVRSLRLAALIESPDAFSMNLALEVGRSPESWQERLVREDVATWLATEEGRDLGIVVGAPYEGVPDAVGLYSMWVAPPARGRGIAGALVDAVLAWARQRGAQRVLLDVADLNSAALHLYERKGFVATGQRGVLSAERPHVHEHQRVLRLG